MAVELLFDDTYQGARWTYGLNLRPLSYAGCPKGWIINSNKQRAGYRHGTVDYPRQLTPYEVYSYDLEEVN